MRYSRLLEENSFSNRRADYVFLLLLCAAFLLVSLCGLDPASELASLMMTLGYCPATHYAIPLVLPCLLFGVYLVSAEPIDQDEFVWGDHVRPLYLGLLSVLSQSADSIRITAPYLPLCLVAFSWLLQGGFQAAIGDIVS
jgi:Derlin-2/3